MMNKIIAAVIMVCVIGFVAANTVILDHMIGEMLENVEKLDFTNSDAKSEADAALEDFKAKEIYISLTVSHEDISNVKDCFCEMIGSLKAGDIDSANIAKYRLKSLIEHLRRLSGANIDAII